jgi:hypothetical protein
MPSHIDNPTLTLNHIMKCCAASEVGFEPNVQDAALTSKGSYAQKAPSARPGSESVKEGCPSSGFLAPMVA